MRGTWLAQLVQPETLAFRVVSLSPTYRDGLKIKS